MFKQNISDGVGSRNGSNGTPLNPPLFWLYNIFKGIYVLTRGDFFVKKIDFCICAKDLRAFNRHIVVIFKNKKHIGFDKKK